MTSRSSSSNNNQAKTVFAWLVLAAVLLWIFINLPTGGKKQTKTVSPPKTGETTSETQSPAGEKATKAKVLTQILNLRSAMNTEDKFVIGTLKRDDIVEVLEKQDEWLKVRTDDGRKGYVAYKPEFIELMGL